MPLSTLTDDQKIELYEYITKKYPWAKKNNIKRLAELAIRRGEKDFGKKICNSVQKE